MKVKRGLGYTPGPGVGWEEPETISSPRSRVLLETQIGGLSKERGAKSSKGKTTSKKQSWQKSGYRECPPVPLLIRVSWVPIKT